MAYEPVSSKKDDGKAFVGQVRKCWTGWMDVASAYLSDVAEDFNFVRGGRLQWSSKDAAARDAEQLPVLTLNALLPQVNFLSGYALERYQAPRAFPRGSEDEAISRYLTSLIRYALDTSDGESEQQAQFRKGIIGGSCVLEVAHSFDWNDDLIEGELLLTALPPNTCYRDPAARRYDRNDAAFQGKLFWMSQESAQRRWKQHADRLICKDDWTGYDQALLDIPEQIRDELMDVDKGTVRILQHWYRVPAEIALVIDKAEPDPAKAIVQRFSKHADAEKFLKVERDRAMSAASKTWVIQPVESDVAIVDLTSGQPIQSFAKANQAEQRLKQMVKHYGQVATSRFEVLERETTTLRVAHLTGWQLLDDKPSPNGVEWRYPFSHFTCYQDTDDLAATKGIVRDNKDAQRVINWHASMIQETLARGPKGQTWVNRADNHDLKKLRQEISRAGFVGEFATSPPLYHPPGSFSPGDMALMEIARDSIQQGTASSELMGQTTQKTVSGRAIGQRQAGGLVGFAWVLNQWMRTQKYTADLVVKMIQTHYSVEKMSRIIGQDQRIAKQMGWLGAIIPAQEVVFDKIKQIKDLEFDIKLGFDEMSATAREAVFTRMLTMMGSGFPVPPELIVEASDVAYKEEIKAALASKGMQQPNPDMLRAVGGLQGTTTPNGVNQSA